jgi:hypothetical protein
MKTKEDDRVKYHDTPIFRGNYNLILRVFFKNPIGSNFSYCENNKAWLCFINGDEVGYLTEIGIKYAESLCNPDAVKKLIYD